MCEYYTYVGMYICMYIHVCVCVHRVQERVSDVILHHFPFFSFEKGLFSSTLGLGFLGKAES